VNVVLCDDYNRWAKEVMARTEVFDGLLMSELFDFTEIYPGDKTAHFEKIKEDSGVPFEQVSAIRFHIHIDTI
jgi:Acid Phosphatase